VDNELIELDVEDVDKVVVVSDVLDKVVKLVVVDEADVDDEDSVV